MKHVVGLYAERMGRAEGAVVTGLSHRVNEWAPVRAITRAKEQGAGNLHGAGVPVPAGTIWSQVLAELSMVDSDSLCVHPWHWRGMKSRGRSRRTFLRMTCYEQVKGLAEHRNARTAQPRDKAQHRGR